jgi:hypothetical protein
MVGTNCRDKRDTTPFECVDDITNRIRILSDERGGFRREFSTGRKPENLEPPHDPLVGVYFPLPQTVFSACHKLFSLPSPFLRHIFDFQGGSMISLTFSRVGIDALNHRRVQHFDPVVMKRCVTGTSSRRDGKKDKYTS